MIIPLKSVTIVTDGTFRSFKNVEAGMINIHHKIKK